jgi:hypothetical protein
MNIATLSNLNKIRVVRVAIYACQEVGEVAQILVTKSMDEQMATIPFAGSDFSPDWNRPVAAVHE